MLTKKKTYPRNGVVKKAGCPVGKNEISAKMVLPKIDFTDPDPLAFYYAFDINYFTIFTYFT